jgi:hypothetical protein
VPSSSAFADLHPKHQRRLVAVAVLRTVFTVTLTFVLYAVLPIDRANETGAVLLLLLGLVAVVAVVALQARAIGKADYPWLRVVESLSLALSVFIAVFAVTYFAISQIDSASFNEPLKKTSAVYFTVTVLSTVGFGDIVPRTGLARMVVTVQMLLDLGFVAVIVRVLLGTARRGSARDAG